MTTGRSKTREEALGVILGVDGSGTGNYEPLAYKMDGSTCSCCRSECIYLLCQTSDRKIRLFVYHGDIPHTPVCHGIRCTCNAPFMWTNIQPREETVTEESELRYWLSQLTSVKEDDNTWKQEWKDQWMQEKENEAIRKYNESDDEGDNESDNETEEDAPLKNRHYYFPKTSIN